MRTDKWLILALVIGILTVGLVGGCGDDDDDDDDVTEDDDDDTVDDDDDMDDDDTTDDDDDTVDDDDDATGNVDITNLAVGECGEAEPDPEEEPLNIVEAKWADDVLSIDRINARVNCGVDLTVIGNLESGVLTITENDAGNMDCRCAADVSYDVEGLPETDEITVVIQYQAEKGWGDIARFVIETAGDDYEWVLPNVEGIVHDPSYPANQDMEIRVNACNIEDASLIEEDPYKLQIYSAMIDGTVAVYTLDRRNLTNPGEISELCSMIYWDMPGLAAGVYPLIALGFLEEDYFVWVDITGGLVVE